MQKAGEGASGLHPPSAPSSLYSRARHCHCKSFFSVDRKANARCCPDPGVRKHLPFCRGKDAPLGPTPCISYVPELSRPKAKQQETPSPGVLGSRDTHKPVSEMRLQNNRKRWMSQDEQRSSLIRDGHIGDCSSLGGNGSEGYERNIHWTNKTAKADWLRLFFRYCGRGSEVCKGTVLWAK